jgi:acetyl-CoA C-acetyltransferase
VAAAHPAAWFPERRSPIELATISPDNRLVSEPYPKRMCAVINVDQAAAVLVTSLAEARRAGVADRAVFCVAGADANDVWFPSARPDPGSSPAIAAATGAALGAAGTGLDDVGVFDLYSCFPCAVEMAAAALGVALDDGRGFTVTGGLPYFGGPGNNYTLHAIATMADRLRRGGGTGLVTGLGWYATKHAVGIYSSEPPARGWRRGDTTQAQADIDASAVEVAGDAVGPATVLASTVVAGHDGKPRAAPVIARLADGRHVAAAAEDDELPALDGRNLVGERIVISGPLPRFRLAG